MSLLVYGTTVRLRVPIRNDDDSLGMGCGTRALWLVCRIMSMSRPKLSRDCQPVARFYRNPGRRENIYPPLSRAPTDRQQSIRRPFSSADCVTRHARSHRHWRAGRIRKGKDGKEQRIHSTAQTALPRTPLAETKNQLSLLICPCCCSASNEIIIIIIKKLLAAFSWQNTNH